MKHTAMASASALLVTLALLPAQIGAAPYMSDAEDSRLEFSFHQAGARNSGQFRTFSVELELPAADGGGRLDVVIDVASLNTQDGDRDSMLNSAYFFDTDFHPQARFESKDIVATGEGRYTANGHLTIRETTREISLPFILEEEPGNTARQHLHGHMTLRRLDYGVGQGEWRATTWIRNDVTISYSVKLTGTAAET